MHFPSITIITMILNPNKQIFTSSLESVKKQKYPGKVEHLVMDGGSTNGSVDLARKYGCRVTIRKELPEQEQERPVIAMKMAKGDLILILESDNILTSSTWLLDMVTPFIENKKVFCTYSAYNSYRKDMSLTTKYTGLFGSSDPTLNYLKKSEKIRMDQKDYDKGLILKHTKKYDVVKFTRDTLPTLGDNGHMFLRKVMLKVLKNPEDYIHPDAFMQMFDLGYDTFGVVKNSVIHVMNPNLLTLVKRRVTVKRFFYDGRRGKRKYLVYNPDSPRDKINLIKYIISSLTLVVPFFEALRGYIKIREKAWFLHPIMCFLMTIGYGVSEVKWILNKRFNKT